MLGCGATRSEGSGTPQLRLDRGRNQPECREERVDEQHEEDEVQHNLPPGETPPGPATATGRDSRFLIGKSGWFQDIGCRIFLCKWFRQVFAHRVSTPPSIMRM